ncbi:GGDEF domain-containing protein [Roseovarius sp. D0-M9]|uniref:GGDEF domain-containing protein n=1 Tax=Roseovarius sp. D0-M9 TaxID=3127117 RepID=UPI0030100BC4
MNTYARLSKLFPRSFTAKVFFIAFCGTHLPLIVTVSFLLIERGSFFANLEVVIVMLIGTLVGTAATLMGLNAILRPLYHVRDAMESFELRREKVALASHYRDEVGEIMSMANRLIADVDFDLRRKADAANTDPLTGLLNRRGFEEMLSAESAGAIIFADLDHFKSVNDMHGHGAGGLMLREVASVFSQATRSNDIISRFGGEEFVMFLPNADLQEAVRVAERARVEIESHQSQDGMSVTASFGISVLNAGDSVKSSLKQADRAVYIAKSSGRNRVCLADEAA